MRNWRFLGPVLLAASFAFAPTAHAADFARSTTSIASPDDTPVLARRRRRGKKATPKSAPAAAQKKEDAIVENATRRGPTRIEFDERLLQGQTNKANAIYLFQRRASALRSLVKKRKHFHREIDEELD